MVMMTLYARQQKKKKKGKQRKMLRNLKFSDIKKNMQGKRKSHKGFGFNNIAALPFIIVNSVAFLESESLRERLIRSELIQNLVFKRLSSTGNSSFIFITISIISKGFPHNIA